MISRTPSQSSSHWTALDLVRSKSAQGASSINESDDETDELVLEKKNNSISTRT